MGWAEDLKQYRDERHDLIQLQHRRDALDLAFKEETAGMKRRSHEYQEAISEFFHDLDEISSEIAEIETKQMLRRAKKWRIPVPPRPFRDKEISDSWEWHDVHAMFYLKDTAISRIRKEVYQEWEMWSKPWLSWMAILISVTSLAVSVFKP